MKILLSAYECEPNRGSEFGRGWAWVNKLASLGHEIWVITLSNNQPGIEKELQRNPKANLHFIYCEKVSWLPWAYKITNILRLPIGAKIASQVSKIWWQWDAYQIAKFLSKKVQFDLIHHVTNSTVRRPSFMGLLGIPFIVGPLAGGVKTPWSLRKSYPSSGWISDFARDIANGWVQFDPLMHLTFAKATKIYCDCQQTQLLIPKLYRSKSEVLFSMPTYEMNDSSQVIERDLTEKANFRVLFVGRFLYWKGIHLALKAFAQLHQKIPGARFTLIGSGSEKAWLQKLTKQLEVEEAVEWLPWMEQTHLSSAYLHHDVFLFPSLHDMGGNVILESFYHGLPVVCLDLGGPGVMVNETCGRVIRTDEFSEEVIVQMLSDALLELAENPKLLWQLSEGALARPSKFLFNDVVKHIYENIGAVPLVTS